MSDVEIIKRGTEGTCFDPVPAFRVDPKATGAGGMKCARCKVELRTFGPDHLHIRYEHVKVVKK